MGRQAWKPFPRDCLEEALSELPVKKYDLGSQGEEEAEREKLSDYPDDDGSGDEGV